MKLRKSILLAITFGFLTQANAVGLRTTLNCSTEPFESTTPDPKASKLILTVVEEIDYNKKISTVSVNFDGSISYDLNRQALVGSAAKLLIPTVGGPVGNLPEEYSAKSSNISISLATLNKALGPKPGFTPVPGKLLTLVAKNGGKYVEFKGVLSSNRVNGIMFGTISFVDAAGKHVGYPDKASVSLKCTGKINDI